MTRNTLGDMHNILMEQLERLNEADDEGLEGEIKRSKAMAELAVEVIDNANTMLSAARLQAAAQIQMPRMLSAGEGRVEA